ncbi:MAG: FAD-dependent oxidoreductase, partial [Alphaproteobacteria bacterium]
MRKAKVPDLPESCDLLVVGSGAAGMAAAISARHHGLRPVIIEKSDLFGGSTAVSGGAIWVPGNPIAAAAGMTDSREAARRYIQGEAGNLFNAELVDA